MQKKISGMSLNHLIGFSFSKKLNDEEISISLYDIFLNFIRKISYYTAEEIIYFLFVVNYQAVFSQIMLSTGWWLCFLIFVLFFGIFLPYYFSWVARDWESFLKKRIFANIFEGIIHKGRPKNLILKMSIQKWPISKILVPASPKSL